MKYEDHYILTALDFPDPAPLMQSLQKELDRMQEEVLMKVVSQCLGRPAVLEDAKRLTIFKYPPDLRNIGYDLDFDGVKIGCIRIENTMSNWTVTFHPEKDILKMK